MSYNLLVLLTGILDHPNEELLETVRDAHLRSRQAIRTLYVKAEATVTYHGPKPRAPSHYVAEWWQDADSFLSKVLLIDNRDGERVTVETDGLLVNGRGKKLRREAANGKSAQPFGEIGEMAQLGIGMSPWAWGLFEMVDSVGMADALLKSGQYVERVESDLVEGKKYVRVDFKRQGEMELSAWFDPTVNYLVARYVGNNSNSGIRDEHVVKNFLEPEPGVFFPAAVHYKVRGGDKLTLETSVVVKSIRINDKIEPNVFSLVFPKGTAVTDEIAGVRYVSLADETPDTSHGVRTLPPKSKGRIQHATGQAPIEPTKWSSIAYWIVALLVMSCGGFLIIKRFRTNSPLNYSS